MINEHNQHDQTAEQTAVNEQIVFIRERLHAYQQARTMEERLEVITSLFQNFIDYPFIFQALLEAKPTFRRTILGKIADLRKQHRDHLHRLEQIIAVASEEEVFACCQLSDKLATLERIMNAVEMAASSHDQCG